MLAASGGFNEAVAFTSGAGTLVLGQSQAYNATISGFSTTGGTFLDLSDVGFVGPGEAVFSGTSISGILTVSDGTHTAHIALAGNYTNSAFVCASDGHGGVIIHDPTPGMTTPSSVAATHALVSAMAGMGATGAAPATVSTAPATHAQLLLIAPHAVFA